MKEAWRKLFSLHSQMVSRGRQCEAIRMPSKVFSYARRRRKGFHLWIEITPAIDSELANRLQWLLGDDCQRVDFNRARIRSGLNEWNKLYAKIYGDAGDA